MTIDTIQAVTDGHIAATEDEVTISDKASPTGKSAKAKYMKLRALDAEGMGILCKGKMEPATDKPKEGKDERTDADKAAGACDFFNYGFDLDVRAGIRQTLMDSLMGPEKLIKKAFDGMLGAGFYKDEVVATLTNSPKFKDVDGIATLLARLAAAV
jgi:hypothetical protein